MVGYRKWSVVLMKVMVVVGMCFEVIKFVLFIEVLCVDM